MFIESPRRNATSVSPDWLARSTASDDGADTAAITGTPAMTAFCASSKDARPLTRRTVPDNGIRLCSTAQPMHLVDGVVPADVLANHEQGPVGGEQRGAVQAAGAGEHLLCGAQLSGHRGERLGRHHRGVVAGAVPADGRTASRDALPQIPQDEVV